MALIPLILSGGAGTRLWPVSRELHPKPFMRMPDGESLLQKTFARAMQLPGVTEVLTVTNREYFFRTRDEYQPFKTTGVGAGFLLEPFGRNTAGAIALGALRVAAAHGPDSLLLALPADHLIESVDRFRDCVGRAQVLAQEGLLVTFGVVPDAPETGFGYIQRGAALGAEGYAVARFVEKPDAATAATYVAAGDYYWNSGMFCFAAGAFLRELATHAPDVHAAAQRCWEAMEGDIGEMQEIDAVAYEEMPDISLDYALMERSRQVAVVPGQFGWSDIGSWSAVSELATPDAAGNRVIGEAVLVDVANTYVQGEQRLIAAVGVQDLLIVDTPDALLVADRGSAQGVKQVVEQLKQLGHASYRMHRTVHRPWGAYTVLEEGTRFKIKRIVVKPGASLSLQMHYHRSEHWVVVSGTARVGNGESERLVHTNESTYIPAGHRHRLENPGLTDLVIIEVQSGEYLGEDDIVRFDDQYGRQS